VATRRREVIADCVRFEAGYIAHCALRTVEAGFIAHRALRTI